MSYTVSHGAVVDFIEALGSWVGVCIEEVSTNITVIVMADKCTDIRTVEELFFCSWEENSASVQCFLEVAPLKKSRH